MPREAAFGVWVLGWVPDADDAHDTVSTGGGLEVSTDRTVQQQIEVRAGSGAPVVTDAGADVAYTVALVQSLPASELGALAVGASTPGRATGIAVDAEIGAQPQLALVPADVPAELTMSRGATLSTVTIMGEILGEPAAGDETASVSITSHREGEAVNLNAHGFLELAGLVNPGDTAIDRVEISVDVVDAPGLNAEERDAAGCRRVHHLRRPLRFGRPDRPDLVRADRRTGRWHVSLHRDVLRSLGCAARPPRSRCRSGDHRRRRHGHRQLGCAGREHR